MNDLYNRIEALCDKAGITITAMCRASGASRGSLTDLKMGRVSSLNTTTLAKIATYFGISVDYLLGNMPETKKAPTDNGERNDDRLSMLIDLFEKLPEADQNDVIYQLLKKAQSQLDQGDQ